jgi:CheY-like chemotaxis protein
LVRASAVNLFQDLGFEVYNAHNGREALRLLGLQQDIGLLVVDVRMSGMDGPELAEAAQQLRPNLKIVFTSGYLDGRALPPEAPFVPKPWQLDQVLTAVTSVVPMPTNIPHEEAQNSGSEPA